MRIAKIGGSLLDWPELVPRLQAWHAAQSPGGTVYLVGGGELADVFRQAAKIHGLADAAAHWLCIGAMQLNGRMLKQLWPELRVIEDPNEAQGDGAYLIEIETWLRRSRCEALPESWDVTSDSIAACCAVMSGAAELVLLKSALPAPGAGRAAAADDGYVDRYFPAAARTLAVVRAVNLRADRMGEMALA